MNDSQVKLECRLCGFSKLKSSFTAKTYIVEKCCECGFFQVKDVPDQATLDAIYSLDYFDNGKYVDDSAIKYEFERRIGLLDKRGLSSDSKVLDYGCATGDFVLGANEKYRCFGTDICAEVIEKAKANNKKYKDNFFELEQLIQLNISFDAVVLWDVIEHLVSPGNALAKIRPMLNNNGLLIVSTPNIGAPIAKLMRSRWAFMTPPEHLGFFTRKSLTHLMLKQGYKVEQWYSKGKHVNLAFFLYKLKRVFPSLVPQWLVRRVSRSKMGRLCIYVPTGDVQYMVCRKIN